MAVRSAKLFPKCKHPMTKENTYSDPSKGPQCRICKRAYMAAYMRERYRPRKKSEARR